MPVFSHLHVHTQYSLLDGAADIKKLYKKAMADNMPALAITGHGNMFGAFEFVAEAYKHKVNPDDKNSPLKVKPIVGCEFYVVDHRDKKQFTKEAKDKRYHQLMLAKNAEGYKNLAKLCSLGYIEGLYSKWPRIDKELILKYHKGLIATTCCLGASVPQAILSKSEDEAEKEFKWWLDLFGDDYYVELQRHDIPEQDTVNKVLLRFAEKYNVKVICSNDSHYVDQEDSNAHDILLCVNTGDLKSTPIATDEEGGRGYRFGFPNDQFFFRTTEQMGKVFADLPQALDNTNEIVDKVELLKLTKDILVPEFPIPPGYLDADEYLRHLTYEGAHKRYEEITPEIKERLDFELHTIKTMGFPGYFLIVADFIKSGRDMGVYIGPGRGSAAGSAVAYCIGITNIDPIKYELLFERFLNPERKSMPDIDTDFDDEGRGKVLNYVINKYGKNQVAQIINYGTMAAKSAIKDVSRVMELPLAEANMLAKLVGDRPGIKLKEAIDGVAELKEIYNKPNDPRAHVLKEALKLEGSVRGTGIHASAVIIAPSDLMEHIPLAVAKDSDLWVTQFEGSVIEDAGLLKMDFLGLRTLSIMKSAVELIRQNHGIEIIPDEIPLDDAKTFELFQKGDTISIFQFESPGMQKYLKELKPDKFDDLIAMNALYRPGPMDYIGNFVARKHGRERITYDLEDMKEYLEPTYGITVYQEQVMLLSQKLAGFSKGEADTLRKAMGKKQKAVLDKMKPQFIEGCAAKGHDPKICEKIWTDWEAFASYAFNKSHSTCYAFVAFQTAYLKAHYPAEYMAAVLSNNLSNIEQLTFFMEECNRMGLKVLGPDVNESYMKFSVNSAGQIRIGLGALKGVGEAAVDSIVEERANGPYKSVFDMARRANMRAVNKRCVEALAYAGAFDSLNPDVHRAQFFAQANDGNPFIEKITRYGTLYQDSKNSTANTLFGGDNEVEIEEPAFPKCEEWSELERLKLEKDVIGIYISGHPLDAYKIEVEHICRHRVADLNENLGKFRNAGEVSIGGIMSAVQHKTTKTGKPFGNFTISDFTGSMQIALFGEDYVNFKNFLSDGYFIYIKAQVRERWNQPDSLELKVSRMMLLDDVREKMVKSLTINLKLDDISDIVVDDLESLIKAHPGNCAVKISVFDLESQIQVDMPSKNSKISVNAAFIKQLEVLAGEGAYKLN
ncbi:MAG: DNA polymerase III subunit alpha [Sphingobacteriales bacterium JAD_PAG50586_3]|nr:MAG: DNA polymerase III subunit alpha [Sphingobacteriales bacterium JAD_PAG50586_3]